MSSFAGCFDTVRYDENRGVYVGKNKSGVEMSFSTIGEYDKYVQSMNALGSLCPVSTVSQRFHNIYNNKPDASIGETGFLEFKPRDPQTQLQYDATSPFWKGEKETAKATSSGIYNEDTVHMYRRNGTKEDAQRFQINLYNSLNNMPNYSAQ